MPPRGTELTLGFAVPSYRNAAALRECLRSIAEHERAVLPEIVVVDDSGTGGVARELRGEFSAVRWVIHERNLGFGAAANRAVLESTAAVVVLLNDDTKLRTAVSAALRAWFARSELFAVTFQSTHADGTFREGAKRLVWRLGIPRVLHNPRDQLRPADGAAYSDYAVGGHCAVRRDYFAALGGFDELFAPFYWEDVDLCARASRRGWKIVYDAALSVEHAGPSAIRSSYDAEQIRRAVWRNRILFARRHARGGRRWLLPSGLCWQRFASMCAGDLVFPQALAEANAVGRVALEPRAQR
jgi:GT2 family glycosyltransferase